MSTLTQTEITARNHRRAVRFFWGLLIGATTVSLLGNIAHAVLPHLPRIVVQIGAAAVTPIALLAAVHGIALAVRAGASGRVYCWAVTAVAAIGAGAFAVSFIALRDLMLAIGYTPATAWAFPAIVDTAVAVSTLMLLALGDKPVRRARSTATGASTQAPPMRRPAQNAKQAVMPVLSSQSACAVGAGRPGHGLASAHLDAAQTVRSAQAEVAQDDADVASDLIASGITTQAVDTVVAVLSAHRDGASINAAARASGINYRTAQRIVEAAVEHRQKRLVAVG
jgi:hypothetical protein